MKRKLTVFLAAALALVLVITSALALSYTINYKTIPGNDISALDWSASQWLSTAENRALLTVASYRALASDPNVSAFEAYLTSSMVCYCDGQVDIYISGANNDIAISPPVGKSNDYFWYFVYSEKMGLAWYKSQRANRRNDKIYENKAEDIAYAIAHYDEYFGRGSGNGWKQDGGAWYYYQNNKKATGWLKDGGAWYYFDKNGKMQTGWVKDGGAWYYMSGSGAMVTGWQKLGGVWYYFQGGGTMATGWQKLGGVWYYFDGSGAMVTGQQNIGGTVYTFSSDGTWLY